MRPCPVARTQQLLTSSGGFSVTPPLTASALPALNWWELFPWGEVSSARVPEWAAMEQRLGSKWVTVPSFLFLTSRLLWSSVGWAAFWKLPHGKHGGYNWLTMRKKIKLELQVMAAFRIKSRWLGDLNVKHEIIKIVKEKNWRIFIILEGRGSVEDHSEFNTNNKDWH